MMAQLNKKNKVNQYEIIIDEKMKNDYLNNYTRRYGELRKADLTEEKDVIKELEKVSLSGERVNLHFVKRYKTFFWRGDTRYFVTKVERLPNQ